MRLFKVEKHFNVLILLAAQRQFDNQEAF